MVPLPAAAGACAERDGAGGFVELGARLRRRVPLRTSRARRGWPARCRRPGPCGRRWRHLRGGLACGEDHLRHAGAQGAMMVELGEAEIFKRQIAQALQGFGDAGAAFAHFVEQRLRSAGDPSAPLLVAAVRRHEGLHGLLHHLLEGNGVRRGESAAVLILGRGVGDLAGRPAGDLDAHLAPGRCSTSTNSRGSASLFSMRQCRPMVVVSRKSSSRSAGTRSGRQSTVICTPLRPFFICTAVR